MDCLSKSLYGYMFKYKNIRNYSFLLLSLICIPFLIETLLNFRQDSLKFRIFSKRCKVGVTGIIAWCYITKVKRTPQIFDDPITIPQQSTVARSMKGIKRIVLSTLFFQTNHRPFKKRSCFRKIIPVQIKAA